LLSRSGAGRYRWIWAAAVPILIWTVVRLFGLERGYPGIALMAFTPYVGIAALLVVGVASALRNWAAATLAAIAMFCLAAVILPRAIGSETTDPSGHETLTVLSTNIHHGTADADAVVALVDRYHPDLLGVQELTPKFAAELKRAGIERRLPESMLLVHRSASGGASTRACL
jgi:endonuclease/exonuclease/phosphatase (EEP) superfamily protein YafD